ncbi:hypothetical protein [Elizabethkingia phage TCUEAP3]|nr:hypothetical protein [Elizabethkingia phage TCUEAP3]
MGKAIIFINGKYITLQNNSKNRIGIDKWKNAIALMRLKEQLNNAINEEDYLLAHELKNKIEHINKTSQ